MFYIRFCLRARAFCGLSRVNEKTENRTAHVRSRHAVRCKSAVLPKQCVHAKICILDSMEIKLTSFSLREKTADCLAHVRFNNTCYIIPSLYENRLNICLFHLFRVNITYYYYYCITLNIDRFVVMVGLPLTVSRLCAFSRARTVMQTKNDFGPFNSDCYALRLIRINLPVIGVFPTYVTPLILIVVRVYSFCN